MSPPIPGYNFTVSPDFNPDKISGWFIFNTWLQRQTAEHIHLELYQDFTTLQAAIGQNKLDLIYANPYDTADLVRNRGFVPIVKPIGKQDEGVIIVRQEHPAQRVEDLGTDVHIASTDDPDVNMICMIMLEPAELNASNTQRVICDNHLLVAKSVLKGSADVGFVLKDAYEEFSKILRSQLRVLVTSSIRDIYHTLLAGPRLAHKQQELQRILLDMQHDLKGPGVLQSLGFSGWEIVEQEDMEFMIDLMDTLED